MNRFSGPLADAIFVFFYVFLIPAASAFLAKSAVSHEELYATMSLYATIFYPLACLAMLQKMATSEQVQDGLRTFNTAIWKWYSWPLGLMIWTAMLFHSVIMTLGFYLGDMVRGNQGFTMFESTKDQIMLWLAIAIFIIVTGFIIFRLLRIDLRSWFKRNKDGAPMSLGFKIFYVIIIAIIGPLYVITMLCLAVATPFYLYCVIWYYGISKSRDKKPMAIPLPKGEPYSTICSAILQIYAVVLAFFFDSFVTYITSRGPHGDASATFNALFAMALFYFPFRMFFGIESGRNWFGWASFAVSVIIVFVQTVIRLKSTTF